MSVDSHQTPLPSSSAARHERASRLFLEACECPSDQRETWLRERCGDDRDLYDRVTSLLAHDDAESAIDRPVIILNKMVGASGGVEDAAEPPQRIGRYAILGVLGKGGMGAVYRARQESPDRIVALKVMLSSVANPTMIRRFQLEARLLGRLQHPGIAQIFEAGAADTGAGPQPYFVMELVDGEPLLEYAEHHALSMRERLQLIASICDAVHHAHQKGIVHRDLKPGNILVPEANRLQPVCAQPKVLDFGVARVIDPDFRSATLQTDIGQMVGTLPYMSPEQVSGDPREVDVRSDVYALGVIAYELLTGRLPINVSDKSMVEAARLIQTEDAGRLSAIDRGLRGDVETIVRKALEKDKTRRYQSASDLGEDIRRYLRHEPIIARPPSTMYQIRKFARRNPALVTSAAAVVLLLIAAVAGTGYGLVVVRGERDEARRAVDRAEAVRQFFLGVLTTPAPGVAGRDVKVVDALRHAEAGVASAFPDQPEIRGDVYEEMAVTFARLGEMEPAERFAREALRIRSESLGESHALTISAMSNLANVLISPGKLRQPNAIGEARRLLDRAIELLRREHAHDPQLLLEPLSNRASLAFNEEDFETAERLAREQTTIAEQVHGKRHRLAITGHQNLAVLMGRLGQPEQAEVELRTVINLLEDTSGQRSPETITARRALGSTLRTLKRFEDAERLYREHLPTVAEVMGPDHNETAIWHNELGFVLAAQERPAEAVAEYRLAMRIAESSVGSESFLMIVIKDSLSLALVQINELEEAEALCRDCMSALVQMHGASAESTLRTGYKLTDLLLRQGRVDEAVVHATAHCTLAEASSKEKNATLLVVRAGAARSLYAAGRVDQSQSLIDACIRDCPVITAGDHYLTRDAVNAIVDICLAAGWNDRAAALQRKLPSEFLSR